MPERTFYPYTGYALQHQQGDATARIVRYNKVAQAAYCLVTGTADKLIPADVLPRVKALKTYWLLVPTAIRDTLARLASSLDHLEDKSGRDEERRQIAKEFCFCASLVDHAVTTLAEMAVDRGFDDQERATQGLVEAGKRAEVALHR